MTTPEERFRSIKQGKKLLEDLCDPGKCPRVPSIVRDRARAVLRHYPMEHELDNIADSSPEYLDKGKNGAYNNMRQVVNSRG